MTTLELGRLSGVANGLISRYERGLKTPKHENLAKLAAALGVTVDSFYPDTKQPEAMDIGFPVEIGKEVYRIPVFMVSCSAGTFTEHPEQCIEEHIEVPAALCPDKEAGAIRIKGDSMAPDVQEGDLVFFSKNYRIKYNDMVVVMVDNEGLALKRFQPMGTDNPPKHVALVSDNPKYPPRVVAAKEIKSMLKVIGIHRSLI